MVFKGKSDITNSLKAVLAEKCSHQSKCKCNAAALEVATTDISVPKHHISASQSIGLVVTQLWLPAVPEVDEDEEGEVQEAEPSNEPQKDDEAAQSMQV